MKVDGITISKAQRSALVRLRKAERYAESSIPKYINQNTAKCLLTMVTCWCQKLSLFTLTDRGRAVADKLMAFDERRK